MDEESRAASSAQERAGDQQADRVDRPVVLVPVRELLRFASSLPLWQQHLMHSLLVDGAANPADIEVAFQLLLADHGLLEGNAPAANKIDESQVLVDSTHIGGTVLQSLGPMTSVNRIAPDQILPFATNGLTVIYGENGSGKSGYARVLKAIGRPSARQGLLPDVLSQTSAVTPSAVIKFRSGRGESQVEWHAGDPVPAELGAISVFDAELAPVFADEERQLEFLPAGLHVLGALGEIMTSLANRLEAESAQLRNSMPRISVEPTSTQAGRLVGRLIEGQALPTREELAGSAEWADGDETALAELNAALLLDPTKAAARSDRLATALANIAARLRDLETVLGDAAVERLKLARSQAVDARNAANVVGQNLSRDVSLLPHVGSDPWRQMVVYAKEYVLLLFGSAQLPPDTPEPRCPLCQQTLATDAHDRLGHFSAYIEGQAEKFAAEREAELGSLVESATGAPVPSRQDVESVVAAVEPVLSDSVPDLARAGDVFELAGLRQRAILGAKAGEEAHGAGSWPLGLSERLDEHAASLASIALSQRALADEGRRKAVQDAYDELATRRALFQQLPSATKRLELLERLRTLAVARRACDTSAVSRKNSDLRKGFLTSDFESRLRDEFASLGLDHLPLKLSSRSQAGHSLVSVALETHWPVRNREVLSEGELRALALACFLAEAGRIPERPPLVLDDPVSSLDHQRVERVAQRLVAEARKGRQIIIFTHNLVFFHELWMQASEAQVPTATHWLTLSMGAPGYVNASEQPWEVQDVKTRLNELERRLAAAKRIADHASDEYRASVTHFYTGLRETWERLVEEQLLANVVQRFRLGVETRSLRIVEVTDDDYAKVYFAMTRASEFSGHDRAIARQLAAPTPDELAHDLKELRTYHGELKTRSVRLGKQRKARHAPPPGELERGA